MFGVSTCLRGIVLQTKCSIQRVANHLNRAGAGHRDTVAGTARRLQVGRQRVGHGDLAQTRVCPLSGILTPQRLKGRAVGDQTNGY